MGCPDESTALRYVQGGLSPEDGRVIEQHVDGCPSCYAWMTELGRVFTSVVRTPAALAPTVVGDSAKSGVRHASGESRADLSGQRLGRYSVLNKLGAGGMGTVYAARDEVLHREVALKILDAASLGGLDAEEFVLAEARAVSFLHHPNVVGIHDVGALDVFGERKLFLSMELVAGENLAQWLTRTRPSPEQIVAKMLQAIAGLSALHAKGLVHRDLKPENLLVGQDDRVRIADFGLVRSVATTSEALAGTPAYMSPEQLFLRRTDPRSDQFAIGVVLAEALTGRRPFEGRSLEELRWAMSSGAPRGIERLPGALRKVLERALAVDPSRRFPTVDDLARELARAVAPRSNPHLVLHTYASLVMTVFHLGMTTLLVLSLTKDDAAPTARVPSTSSGDTTLDGPTIVLTVIGLLAVLVTTAWIPLGLFWAPLNAWGLFRRQRWARVSTLVYAAMGLLSCFGTPYAIYALVSLTRPKVRAAFDGD
jgi:eukaryotic-like serine/threonine-protein kinase